MTYIDQLGNHVLCWKHLRSALRLRSRIYWFLNIKGILKYRSSGRQGHQNRVGRGGEAGASLNAALTSPVPGGVLCKWRCSALLAMVQPRTDKGDLWEMPASSYLRCLFEKLLWQEAQEQRDKSSVSDPTSKESEKLTGSAGCYFSSLLYSLLSRLFFYSECVTAAHFADAKPLNIQQDKASYCLQ